MAHEVRPTSSYGLAELAVPSSGEIDLDEFEETHRSFHDIALIIGDRQDKGMGSVLVTNRRIIWIGGQDIKTALATAFSNITLHAMAQADEVYRKPCIYMQLECLDPDEPVDEDSYQEDEDVPSPELRLVPRDSNILQGLFEAMCTCAAMNPDDDLEDEEDGSDEGFFYDDAAALEGASADGRMLEHLDSLLQMPRADELDTLLAEDPGRFADADDEDEGGEPAPPNGVARHH